MNRLKRILKPVITVYRFIYPEKKPASASKEKKSFAPHLKLTGRAYRFLGTAPQIGSVRNERNRFVGFVDINNHPIDAGIKNSYLFTARPHYIGAIRRIIVIRPDPIDHLFELFGLWFHR